MFSITIDNASNMVKLVQLMSKDVADVADLLNPEIVPGAEFDALSEENMPAAVGEAEIEENVPECYFYETPEEQTWVKVLKECASNEFITTIRCGAHTTQLVVRDVCH